MLYVCFVVRVCGNPSYLRSLDLESRNAGVKMTQATSGTHQFIVFITDHCFFGIDFSLHQLPVEEVVDLL